MKARGHDAAVALGDGVVAGGGISLFVKVDLAERKDIVRFARGDGGNCRESGLNRVLDNVEVIRTSRPDIRDVTRLVAAERSLGVLFHAINNPVRSVSGAPRAVGERLGQIGPTFRAEGGRHVMEDKVHGSANNGSPARAVVSPNETVDEDLSVGVEAVLSGVQEGRDLTLLLWGEELLLLHWLRM